MTQPPLRTRQFDLIVFDWDGTLCDSTGLIVHCIQAACRDIGADVPTHEAAAWVIGLGLDDALQHAVPGLPRERYPELAQRYRHHYLNDQDALVLFPGVLEMLASLRERQHLLAVATGKTRKGLNAALGTQTLQGVFDATRTADETASKPHPRMLHELMRELGVEPARTLMIGDTTHDLQLAANAGAAAIGVSYGAHEPALFERHETRTIAHSVSELHAWLLDHA